MTFKNFKYLDKYRIVDYHHAILDRTWNREVYTHEIPINPMSG